jgi:hypothetical protein
MATEKREQETGNRDQRSGNKYIGNKEQRTETRIREPGRGYRNIEIGTRMKKCGIGKRYQEAGKMEQRTGTRGLETDNKELGTGNWEQRTGNRELGNRWTGTGNRVGEL